MAKISVAATKVEQSRHTFYLCVLPAGLLSEISYSAVRHRDQEEGAVQRILSQHRIASIRTFATNVGDFPASVVLNWVGNEGLGFDGTNIYLEPLGKSAQIIDGQHRIAGIAAAIAEGVELSNMQMPVAIYENLNTVECANIFLSINTEQKPVPRSLVFDLYGIAGEDLVDPAAVRARDIVLALNDEGQAYAGLIKLPNAKRQRGGIALSTAVTALKPLVEEKGAFEQVGIVELEAQKTIIQNYFKAIESKYGEFWEQSDNAFIYASGFAGAVDFFHLKMLPYCAQVKSFRKEIFKESLRIDFENRLVQEEVKGLGGKDAPKKVFDRLLELFFPKTEETKIDF